MSEMSILPEERHGTKAFRAPASQEGQTPVKAVRSNTRTAVKRSESCAVLERSCEHPAKVLRELNTLGPAQAGELEQGQSRPPVFTSGRTSCVPS